MACKIGIKCGKFSIIHGGHVACLKFCKSLCDYLIVMTQTDSIIEKISGSKPPMPIEERQFILESLKFVDNVSVYDKETEDVHVECMLPWIRKTFRNPHIIMFHSDELENRENVPCERIVDEVIFIPRVFIYKYPPKYTSCSHMIECITKDKTKGK